MNQLDNQGGGTTLFLEPGDSLDSVPESHRDIITNEIRDAFTDPHQYFLSIASRATIQRFRDYVTKLATHGQWHLVLADTYMMERKTVGAFLWTAEGVRRAMIAPGPATFDPRNCHPDFASLYSLVRLVHWEKVAFSGGLLPPSRHRLLQAGDYPESKIFPTESTTVFGNTSCGDLLVHDTQGTAGLFSHENGSAQVLGTITESLEWVFGGLLSGREPNLDPNGGNAQGSIRLWSPPD